MNTHRYNLFFVAILFIHFLISNIIFDSYSIDRAIISIALSFYILFTSLVNTSTIKKTLLLKNPFVLLTIFMIFQACISVFIDTDFEKTQQLFISTTFLATSVIILTAYQTKYKLKDFLVLTAAVSTLIPLVLFLDFAVHSDIDTYTFTRSILTYFQNIRVLNHLQTFFIPALGLLLYINRQQKISYLLMLLLSINFILLLHTGSRGSLYAICFMYLLLFLLNLNNRSIRRHVYVVLTLFIFTTALYFLSPSYMTGNSNALHMTEFSANGRAEIYKTLLPLLSDHEYFTNAIGFFSTDIALYKHFHPHNILLFVYLGSGLVGLIAFVSMCVYYMCLISRRYFMQGPIKRYYTMILLAVGVHSMVSGLYITPLTFVALILYMIPFYTIYFKRDRELRYAKAVNTVIMLAAAVMLLVSTQKALSYKTVYEYPKEYKGTRHYNLGFMLYSNRVFRSYVAK